MEELKLSTREFIPDNSEEIGLVKGSAVIAVNMVKDLLAQWHNIAGGNVEAYKKLIDETVDAALINMKKNAISMNANGISGIKIFTPSVMMGAAEIVVLGTAWKYIS